jgi:phosphatidylserine decarboxylase
MPTRQIEPFVREYHIDMSEFEPVRYRSFAAFFSIGGSGRASARFPPHPARWARSRRRATSPGIGWSLDRSFPSKGILSMPSRFLCNFGRLGFVEVGALSVGRIVQVHPIETAFRRGEEKSVFRFGGSAIVVFGEPAAW